MDYPRLTFRMAIVLLISRFMFFVYRVSATSSSRAAFHYSGAKVALLPRLPQENSHQIGLSKQTTKNRRLLQSNLEMAFDGGQEDHIDIKGNSVKIRIDNTGTARARSTRSYPLGTTFSAQVKCPEGDLSGIVTGFYISSNEGQENVDEVDFEFVGSEKSQVQTNYFVRGDGHHEEYFDIGGDCSSNFTTFSIVYGPVTQFLIGGRVVRLAFGFTRNVYLYVIGWWGGDPSWVGTTEFKDAPYFFQVKDITVS